MGLGLGSILLHMSATEASGTPAGQQQQSQYTKWVKCKLSAVKTCTFSCTQISLDWRAHRCITS